MHHSVPGLISYQITNPVGLGTFYSEPAVYNAIYTYGLGYCTSSTQPPPYSWTMIGSTYFPGISWQTLVSETGTTGNCSGTPTPFSQNWSVGKYKPQSCPAGWTPGSGATVNFQFGFCFRTEVQPCQNGQCTQTVSDPIDVADGNEIEREVDVPGNRANPLPFVRTYNYFGTIFGPGAPSGAAGQGWSHTYERRLWVFPAGAMRALRPDGTSRVFLPVSGGYQEFGTAVDKLTSSGSGLGTHRCERQYRNLRQRRQSSNDNVPRRLHCQLHVQHILDPNDNRSVPGASAYSGRPVRPRTQLHL